MFPRSFAVLLTALLAYSPLSLAHPTSPLPPSAIIPHPGPNSQALLHPQQPAPTLSGSRPHPPRQTRLPTKHESLLLARRLLAKHHTSTGSLATIFPPSANLTSDPVYRYTPSSVADAPIALPEYFAGDCDPSGRGEPVMIRLGISTLGKNSRHGTGNVSLGVDWEGSYAALTGKKAGSAAALPRLSVLGWLEVMSDEEVRGGKVVECFERVHGDARGWRPGSERGAHSGEWVRLRISGVYWVGGFGDRAWIGWLDVGEGEEGWSGVERREWEGVRLPGEEGWGRMPWFEQGKGKEGVVEEL